MQLLYFVNKDAVIVLPYIFHDSELNEGRSHNTSIYTTRRTIGLLETS